ncbi:MAG: ATP-binding cassette domain-containing protein [Planctomycetaceae bacterium]
MSRRLAIMAPNPTSLDDDSRSLRQIELRGVRVNNLRGIDLDLPLGQFVVLSGVSGAGKSSLAFDTIFAEGQRRYIESFSSSARQYLERIERPNADRIAHVPPAIGIRTDSALRKSLGRATVASLAEVDSGLKRLFARIGRVVCPDCQCHVQAHAPIDVARTVATLAEGTRFQICFSPANNENLDAHAWLTRGFTRVIDDSRSLVLSDFPVGKALSDSWIVVDRLVAGKASTDRIIESSEVALNEGNGRCVLFAESGGLDDPDSHGKAEVLIDDHMWTQLRFSRHWDCPSCRRQFYPPEIRLFEPEFQGGCPVCRDPESQLTGLDCATCRGTRLFPAALAVRIGNTNLADILEQTATRTSELLSTLANALSDESLRESALVRQELTRRIQSIINIGLGHLRLLRGTATLSGGQIRRLILAAAIGSRITGTLCLIDEPSAGLHRTELPLVVGAVRKLVDLRNSVIVVDHSPAIIQAADYVVDLGPGAGPAGGSIVFAGQPSQLASIKESATGQELAKPGGPNTPARTPRVFPGWMVLEQVNHRNLKNVNVKIPLGGLCVVTGPGGAGKSTLVMEVLIPALSDVLAGTTDSKSLRRMASFQGGESLSDVAVIDRSPLTRSSRSNAATWIEAFDEIREIFGSTAEAKLRGFGVHHFSFNAAQGGRCRACHGTGILRHDMQFLPDVTLTCPECHGTRFRREILDVKYRGKSIADVLAMSASEALAFFRNHPRLQARLQMLKQIGLEYLVLGQPTDSLSGGEAQRLKLAARLTTSRGPTLIACDEPSAGLHPADVARLIGCFEELLGIGHSIVVIDNSVELLAAADHVIELPSLAE